MRASALAPVLLSVLRIVSGLIFLEHGTQKFFSFPPGQAAGSGLAFANPAAYAGLIEIVCGLLIAIGLFTRPAAFLAAGTMAVAYWLAHFPRDFSRSQYGRRGDPLLLRLPLRQHGRSRALEPGRPAQARNAAALDFRPVSCYTMTHRSGCLCIRTR